jgi:hypothetical protein
MRCEPLSELHSLSAYFLMGRSSLVITSSILVAPTIGAMLSGSSPSCNTCPSYFLRVGRMGFVIACHAGGAGSSPAWRKLVV